MAFLDPVFNPVFLPLLNLSPVLGLLLLSFLISLLVTYAYKWLTNQTLMKELKEKQTDFQKKMKELRSSPEEMLKVQKEAMKVNMEYMKHSFKPTLFTMLPILLIFGWMAGHLAFEPIYPQEAYSVTAFFKEGLVGNAMLIADENTEIVGPSELPITSGSVTWALKSSEGSHLLTVKMGTIEQSKKVLISKELKYEDAVSLFDHSDITQIKLNYKDLKPLGTFSLFGWHPGWLGIYIILSLIFSIALRKVLKIY